MVTFAQLVCVLLLPLGLGVLLTAAARGLLTSSTARHRARGIGGLVLGVIVLVAQAAWAGTSDAPLAPPRSGWFWLPWALLLGVVPAVTLALPPGWWRWLVQVAVAVAGGALVLFPVSHSAQDILFSGLWIAGGTLCILLSLWASCLPTGAAITSPRGVGCGPGSDAPQPLTEQAAAAVVGGMVAAGALLSGSKDFGLLALIVPLAILGQAIGGRLLAEPALRSALWVSGTAATAHVVILTLLVNGNYSEMPWYGALPLALALPAGGFAAKFSEKFGGSTASACYWRLAATVAVGLVGLILIAAIGQPSAGSDAASDGPSYHY